MATHVPTLVVVVRPPSRSIAGCELTCIERTPIDFTRLCAQHRAYAATFVEAARAAGAAVDIEGNDGSPDVGDRGDAAVVESDPAGCVAPCRPHLRLVWLPALHDLPDAMFVEDVAIVVGDACVVRTRPGALARRPEAPHIDATLRRLRAADRIFEVSDPGTVDGGDVIVCAASRLVLVGRGTRTNDAGFAQLAAFVEAHGFRCVAVPNLGLCLHLKCSATLLAPGVVLANKRWVATDLLRKAGLAVVEVDTAFAANVLSFALGGVRTIVVAAAATETRAAVDAWVAGRTVGKEDEEVVRVVTLEADEIAKAEGDLTCLSLLAQC